ALRSAPPRTPAPTAGSRSCKRPSYREKARTIRLSRPPIPKITLAAAAAKRRVIALRRARTRVICGCSRGSACARRRYTATRPETTKRLNSLLRDPGAEPNTVSSACRASGPSSPRRRKGPTMPSSKRPLSYVAFTVMLAVCGCSAPGPDASVAADDGDDGGVVGIPPRDADGGVGAKDSGVDPKEGGIGAKDSGIGADDDSGIGAGDDGGVAAHDAGPADDGGTTVPPDAGGGMDECFTCAAHRCGPLVGACLANTSCVDEAECDRGCLRASGQGLIADAQCVAACSAAHRATTVLLPAATCAFAVCPVQCLGTYVSCGGDPGHMGHTTDPWGHSSCAAQGLGSAGH